MVKQFANNANSLQRTPTIWKMRSNLEYANCLHFAHSSSVQQKKFRPIPIKPRLITSSRTLHVAPISRNGRHDSWTGTFLDSKKSDRFSRKFFREKVRKLTLANEFMVAKSPEREGNRDVRPRFRVTILSRRNPRTHCVFAGQLSFSSALHIWNRRSCTRVFIEAAIGKKTPRAGINHRQVKMRRAWEEKVSCTSDDACFSFSFECPARNFDRGGSALGHKETSPRITPHRFRRWNSSGRAFWRNS